MLWDGLIFLLIAGLAFAGWTVGFINSWRGPVAMIVATIATQQFYVDFATWIVQQLRISPQAAVVLGYLLMWCAVEIVCELVLNVALPFGSKNKPMFFNRLGGAAFGFARAIIIVILPIIALYGPMKVPAAPADKVPLINPMQLGTEKSALLPVFTNLGKSLSPGLGPIVVSNKEPSFKPNFSGNTAIDEMNSESGGGSTTTTTKGK